MKRTAIAIAVGALSTGLSHGVLAQDVQDEDPQHHLGEPQQMTDEDAQGQEQFDEEQAGEPGETGFDPHGQGQQPYADDNEFDNDEFENTEFEDEEEEIGTADDTDDDDGLDEDTQVEASPGETDVEVDQEPAEIEVEQEPPEVTVEQQSPDVTIEQPEPDVEVDQAEPDVTVEQEGEADVQVEEAEDASAEIRQQDDEATEEERDQDGIFDDDQNGQDQAAQDQVGQQQMDMQVSDLEGRDIVTQDGDEVGDVERVVRDTQSNETYVIVSEGGFLGFGGDEAAYPIENLEIRSEGELILQSQSGERSVDDFEQDNLEELDGDERLMEDDQNMN
ncbi:PRC-barrel domain-containing protein [Halomonas sp. KM-1]|uniref:PRC-barrel domain-containing protein n=1 Tax=Halomonas sp. KM-1 TaxID=590061 RepID=UPI000287E5C9|nr:PRC-barrel domain-containing protein [Halomonas sp. KM-1]